MSVTVTLVDNSLAFVFSSVDIKIEYTTHLNTRAFWEHWYGELINSDNEFIYLGLSNDGQILSTGLARSLFAIPFANCIQNILSKPHFLKEEVDYQFSSDEEF